MRKFFTFFLLFCSSLVMFAQNSVSASAGNEGGVEEHRYEGMTITYAPVVESADVFSTISYSWKSTVDGSALDLGNSAKLVYTIPSVGTTAGKLVDISVAISGTPKDTLTQPLDTTIHYMLYVYAQPVVSQNAYTANLYIGDETTLSFTTAGGKTGAWTYAWDNAGGTSNSYTFKATSAGEYQVKVLVKNTLGNNYDFTETLTYTIKVWDKCSVSQEAYVAEMFVGNETTLSFSTVGGKTGAWSYVWDNNGGNATSYTFKPTTAGDYQIKVLVKNTLGNTEANYDYSETLTYTIKVWDKCSVSQNAYAANLYIGDETTLSFTTAGGKTGAWTYAWDNAGGTSNSYTFKATSAGEYQVKVLVKNTLGNAFDYTQTLTYTIKVWNKCSVTQHTYPKALYVDDEVTLSFAHAGGKDNAWSYAWDNNGSNATSYTFKPTTAGDYQIKVLVKNTLSNATSQYDYAETLIYTIKVWNKCSVVLGGEDGLNCFTGQKFTYTPQISGGDASKWTYEWYVDNQKVSTSSTYTVTAPEVGNAESKEANITLKVTNTPDNINKPYTQTLNATLKVWPVGAISKSQIERIYYHGDIAYLSVNTQGGYPGGWTYKWTQLGNTQLLGNAASCPIKLTNTSTAKQQHTYQVEWKNAVENNVGSQGVDTIRIDVYAQVVAPALGDEEIKMRDIDTRTISALVGAGGNPDGWSYEWVGATSTSGLSCTIAPEIASNVKDEKYIPIQLKWTNVGPNGEKWEEGVCEKVVHVYNTPANPVLKIKGNGTSNIFIVDDMGMSEEELWNKGYCFRFWDGSSLVEEVNSQRWCRYDHAPANAWVQSVWYYEDGFVCEGEAVTASASYYSPSVKSTVSIYRIDGEFVLQTTVDEMDTMENLYATLDAGLYIVKTENNGIVNTCKIVIR